MSIFKDIGALNFINLFPATSYWTIPSNVYFIGNLHFQNETTGKSYIIERVDPGEAILRNNSNYTKPTAIHPIYTQNGAFGGGGEPTRINLYGPNPNDFNLNSILANYIRKPNSPVWAYSLGGVGQYIFSPIAGPTIVPTTGPVNFELHQEEQTNIIMQILMYAGVVIRDPQIVQNAAQMMNQEQVNEKS
jgi:hypothetical protein